MRNPLSKLFTRAANWIVKNWYEGGFPLQTGERSWLPALVQDARFDQNFMTRRELMRKSRYFYQNNGIVQSLIDIKSQYVIGPSGPHVSPSSSDPDWNERAQLVWKEACQDMGLNGESFADLLDVGHTMKVVDGEIFYIKTRRQRFDAKGKLLGNRPCLQMVEAHRVETPMSRYSDEGVSVFDGLELAKIKGPDGTEQTKRVAWQVRQGGGAFDYDSKFVPVPYDQVLHVFKPHRAEQIRGLSDLFSVMNDNHELDDLEKLENKAMADAAEKSTFIKTVSGEINRDGVRAAGYAKTTPPAIPAQDSGPDPLGTKRSEYFRKVIGGRTVGLKIGEDVSQFLPQRPSEGTRWYWGYKTSKVASALKVPKVLLFPESLQGTVLRAVLSNANIAFTKEHHIWKVFIHQVWEYYMGWAIYNDPRVVDPPADWRHIFVHQPKAVDVDVGYNSAAELNEIRAGLKTFAESYGSRGKDWKKGFDQAKAEQDYAEQIGLRQVFPNAQLPDDVAADVAQEPAEPANEPALKD